MDISGRGRGGETQARRMSHERPSELPRSTSWEVTQRWEGCLRVIDIALGSCDDGAGGTMTEIDDGVAVFGLPAYTHPNRRACREYER